MKTSIQLLVLGLMAVTLVACGGGSGSGSGGGTATTSRTYQGTITGFGSVYVNGVRFDVDSADFDDDGNAASQDDLHVGMQVTVSGSDDGSGQGVATAVRYDDDLEGPVQAIDVAGGAMTVLGVTVDVAADTVFEGYSGLDDPALAVGHVVEVSGYFTAADTIRATYIERKADSLLPGSEVEIKGDIGSLDTMAETFVVRGVTVAYGAAIFDDMTEADLADGLFVEAKGSWDGAVLQASRVEAESRGYDDLGEDEEFELKGPITALTDSSIDVAGVSFLLGDGVSYEDGNAAMLALDVMVEIKGQVNAEGQLVATRIEFEAEDDISIEAQVESVSGNQITLQFFGGIVLETNAATLLEDKVTDAQSFSLADLQAGDWVEVDGYLNNDASVLILTRLRREDAGDEVEIEAPLTAMPTDLGGGNVEIVLLGVTVNTGVGTQYQGSIASAADLLAQAVLGQEIEVQGAMSSTDFMTASEVEYGDE